MIDIKKLTIEDAHAQLLNGEYTVKDLVDACLARIKERNETLNAILEVYSDIDEQVKNAEKIFKEGKATVLTGIPIVIKDNMLFEGHKVSAASKILEDYTAPYTATAILRLQAQGMVILGRANMDEFAMGTSTENSAHGPTKNPHDETRVPGGSSGGSAAAVADGMCLGALGTDTGGSVRQPAALSGVVGYKPTYGMVSRYGIIAMGNSLDQIGTLGKSVVDAKVLYDGIVGYDPLDAQSIPENIRKEKEDTKAIKVIGVPWQEIEREGIDPETLTQFKSGVKKLQALGYEVRDISLPLMPFALSVYYIVMPAEVSTNLARYDGIRYGYSSEGKDLFEVYARTRGRGFGPETRRRIMLGTYVLSHGYYDAYYRRAISVREAIKKEFQEAFKEIDAIAMPTSPTPAFLLGEKTSDPLALYLADVFTVPANIVGLPAISIPNGATKSGLPLDMQLMAPWYADEELFNVALAFEKGVN